jgi:hypothetical protein
MSSRCIFIIQKHVSWIISYTTMKCKIIKVQSRISYYNSCKNISILGHARWFVKYFSTSRFKFIESFIARYFPIDTLRVPLLACFIKIGLSILSKRRFPLKSVRSLLATQSLSFFGCYICDLFVMLAPTCPSVSSCRPNMNSSVVEATLDRWYFLIDFDRFLYWDLLLQKCDWILLLNLLDGVTMSFTRYFTTYYTLSDFFLSLEPWSLDFEWRLLAAAATFYLDFYKSTALLRCLCVFVRVLQLMLLFSICWIAVAVALGRSLLEAGIIRLRSKIKLDNSHRDYPPSLMNLFSSK